MKNKIIVFGGTGYIGSHILKASVKLGHPTYIYSRPNSTKKELLHEFESMGVICIKGELEEHDKLVNVLKKVDVVISALAYPQIFDQLKIIDAIKVVDNIKRFVPSDFGAEEDSVCDVLSPFQTLLDNKKMIRRAIEAAAIPHTFMSTNCFAAYFVNLLIHPHQHNDFLTIYGDGEAKAVLNFEEDVAMYTLKVATDTRTLNRVVILQPPDNVISQNELIALWEKKRSTSFTRIHVPEQDIVTLSNSLPYPENLKISIIHSVFVKGITAKMEIGMEELEASKLYPEVGITSVDRLLDVFISNPPKPVSAAF